MSEGNTSVCVCDVEKCAKRYMYANQLPTVNHQYATGHEYPEASMMTAVLTTCDATIQDASSQFLLRSTWRGCST